MADAAAGARATAACSRCSAATPTSAAELAAAHGVPSPTTTRPARSCSPATRDAARRARRRARAARASRRWCSTSPAPSTRRRWPPPSSRSSPRSRDVSIWRPPRVPGRSPGYTAQPFDRRPVELSRAARLARCAGARSMAALSTLGAREFVDVGPGRVLERLVKRNVAAAGGTCQSLPETRPRHAADDAARRAPPASPASAPRCPRRAVVERRDRRAARRRRRAGSSAAPASRSRRHAAPGARLADLAAAGRRAPRSPTRRLERRRRRPGARRHAHRRRADARTPRRWSPTRSAPPTRRRSTSAPPAPAS